MALTACRECGQQVATGANHCPHCGANVPGMSDGSRFAMMALLAAALVILLVVYFASLS